MKNTCQEINCTYSLASNGSSLEVICFTNSAAHRLISPAICKLSRYTWVNNSKTLGTSSIQDECPKNCFPRSYTKDRDFFSTLIEY